MIESLKKLAINTDAALDHAKSCANHHKTWRVMELFFFSLTDEIFLIFHNDLLFADHLATFWGWAQNRTDDNIIYPIDMVLTYLFSILLFSSSVRNYNYDAVSCSMAEL